MFYSRSFSKSHAEIHIIIIVSDTSLKQMCIKAEDWDGLSAAVKLRQSKSFVIMCNNILITGDYRYSMQLAFPVGNN